VVVQAICDRVPHACLWGLTNYERLQAQARLRLADASKTGPDHSDLCQKSPNFAQKTLSFYGELFSRVPTSNSSARAPVLIAFQIDNLGIELAVFTYR
jgi:hypothetical protein